VSAATSPPPPPSTTGSGGAAPVSGGAGSPEAPAPEACPLCGAPLAADQEWCLHCGAAARTRLATSSNWRAPIIAVAVVVVLSLGVLTASLLSLSGSSGSTVRRTVTTGPAATPATTSPAPTASSPSASTPGATASTSSTPGSPGTASGPLSRKPVVTPPAGPPPTKVEIKELVAGTGPEARVPDTVTVNYVGILYSGGAEFDSSWRRDTRFTFTLGTGQVITGWNQGVSGMKVGGRRELIVPASLAYGAKGLETRPVAIPPNAALVFVVDLLKV